MLVKIKIFEFFINSFFMLLLFKHQMPRLDRHQVGSWQLVPRTQDPVHKTGTPSDRAPRSEA